MLLFGRNNSSRTLELLNFEASRFSLLAKDFGELAQRPLLEPDDCIFPEDAPVLHSWRIAPRGDRCLSGLCDHHPALGFSRQIITSNLMAYSEELGWARTLSRWYRLENKSNDDENR